MLQVNLVVKKMKTGAAIVITNKQTRHEIIVTENNDIELSWEEIKRKWGYDDCPRRNLPSGVGYDLCKKICKQKYHAEASATENGIRLGILPVNNIDYAELYLWGHWYACSDCLNRMERAGIRKYYVLSEEFYKDEIEGILLMKEYSRIKETKFKDRRRGFWG